MLTFPGPYGATLIICWGNNTTGHKHSSSFLECVDDNILTQLIKEPTREGCSAEPHAYLQRRTGCWCVGKGQLWLQGLSDGGVCFRILRGGSKAKKQGHKLGLQESRLLPFQISAWKNPMGYGPEEGLRNAGWIMLNLPRSLLRWDNLLGGWGESAWCFLS